MTAAFETVSTCRVCGVADLREVLDLGAQPPANSLFRPGDAEPPAIPLRLMFCHACATAQLGETVEPEYLFGQYVWVTGTSLAAREHSRVLAHQTLERAAKERPAVVEVASNDGTVLRRFQDAGCDVLGVDPARNIAEAASAAGIPTMVEFFTDELARDLAQSRGVADVVIARNVLPHVKSINSVVRGMSEVLADDGIAVAEFHDAGVIESELHYDSIYHEHLFYFTLTSMTRLFSQVGLYPFDVLRSPISGGSWVLYLSKDSGRDRGEAGRALETEATSGIDKLDTWQTFGDRSRGHAVRLKEILEELGSDLIGYGASARSSTLLNFCGLNSHRIRVVIDRNPMKHGMLTPGTSIPVVSFEEGLKLLGPQEVVLLLSWNLKDEIIHDLRSGGFEGRIIVPLPGEPVIL
jgi:SAM-dependent methyltransferase